MKQVVAPPIFDRNRKKIQRNRIAMDFDQADYLFERVTCALSDRLLDIKKDFKSILQIGAHDGRLREYLKKYNPDFLITTDHAENFVKIAQQNPIPGEICVCLDEELLPFAEDQFDLVIAPLTLHWVNDLPGCLSQIRRLLKPDGLFLGAVIGQDSLLNLRESFLAVETNLLGGVRPHLSPSLDVKDLGSLLQRAGFALPVIDKEMITVSYAHLFDLMKDLRQMGQSSALMNDWKNFSAKSIFTALSSYYVENYKKETGIIGDFDILYLSGWAPHHSQQKPLKPGSASAELSDFLF